MDLLKFKILNENLINISIKCFKHQLPMALANGKQKKQLLPLVLTIGNNCKYLKIIQ